MAVFLDFFRNGTLQRTGVFLSCNQCIKTLHLSYPTPPYNNFNFLGYNGILQFFRPLVAGVKHQIFISRKIFSVFLWHKAYKITQAGNLSLILREILQKGPPLLYINLTFLWKYLYYSLKTYLYKSLESHFCSRCSPMALGSICYKNVTQGFHIN